MFYNRSLLHLRSAAAVRLVARIEGNKDISHLPCRFLCCAFDHFYLGPIRKYVQRRGEQGPDIRREEHVV